MLFLLHGLLEERFEIFVMEKEKNVMAQGTVKWFNESKGLASLLLKMGLMFLYIIHPSRAAVLRPLLKVIRSALILKKARKVPRQ